MQSAKLLDALVTLIAMGSIKSDYQIFNDFWLIRVAC